jgi:sigma-B regulation protein RsbU (phosphoserine phosphatase)
VSGERARAAFYDALVDDDAEKLYEQAPCGYLTTAPDGTIVKANQTFLTLTGYERSELLGRRRFADLLSAGGRIYHETHYAPMLSMQGKVREIALDIVRADGVRLPVLVNSVLERDATGAPVVVRTAVFDATDRREYERELLRAKTRAEESELRATALARTLQQTLIPPTAPHIPGLDVAAVYRPAGTGEEVGGDFYDIFQVSAHEWVVAIGDVCGKGVDAAIVTALVRHSLRAIVVRLASPTAALATLNEILLRHETDRFCTVALVWLRLDGDIWTATAAIGGHPLPLLARAGSAAKPVPFGVAGSLIGVLGDAVFHDASVRLAADDVLLLYTDGVTEGRCELDFFGEERLTRALADLSRDTAASVAEGVLDDVLAFQRGNPRDDIALVAVRVPEAREER